MLNQRNQATQSILLVEDSADDYEATARAFKKANMANRLLWCQSGQDAIDFLHGNSRLELLRNEEKPGMILLDLNMPGLDGHKTLQLIKNNDSLKLIPVIILTTSSDERDIIECYRMGANSYISKPVSFDGMIQAIQRLKEYWFEIALLPKSSDNG